MLPHRIAAGWGQFRPRTLTTLASSIGFVLTLAPAVRAGQSGPSLRRKYRPPLATDPTWEVQELALRELYNATKGKSWLSSHTPAVLASEYNARLVLDNTNYWQVDTTYSTYRTSNPPYLPAAYEKFTINNWGDGEDYCMWNNQEPGCYNGTCVGCRGVCCGIDADGWPTRNVVELDLSCNGLHGSFPESFGSLTKLRKLSWPQANPSYSYVENPSSGNQRRPAGGCHVQNANNIDNWCDYMCPVYTDFGTPPRPGGALPDTMCTKKYSPSPSPPQICLPSRNNITSLPHRALDPA